MKRKILSAVMMAVIMLSACEKAPVKNEQAVVTVS